jgi:hypothetical protein
MDSISRQEIGSLRARRMPTFWLSIPSRVLHVECVVDQSIVSSGKIVDDNVPFISWIVRIAHRPTRRCGRLGARANIHGLRVRSLEFDRLIISRGIQFCLRHRVAKCLHAWSAPTRGKIPTHGSWKIRCGSIDNVEKRSLRRWRRVENLV